MSATIDRNLPIAVTLPAEQWQVVMELLSIAPAPHKVVHPLLMEIQAQCMRRAEPPPEHMPMRVAGGMAQTPTEPDNEGIG